MPSVGAQPVAQIPCMRLHTIRRGAVETDGMNRRDGRESRG